MLWQRSHFHTSNCQSLISSSPYRFTAWLTVALTSSYQSSKTAGSCLIPWTAAGTSSVSVLLCVLCLSLLPSSSLCSLSLIACCCSCSAPAVLSAPAALLFLALLSRFCLSAQCHGMGPQWASAVAAGWAWSWTLGPLCITW